VALATLTDVLRTEDIVAMSHRLLPHELAFGNYAPGRFGWILTDVVALKEPVLCNGALGLWTVSAELQARIRAHS
jgi:hypothetical protein